MYQFENKFTMQGANTSTRTERLKLHIKNNDIQHKAWKRGSRKGNLFFWKTKWKFKVMRDWKNKYDTLQLSFISLRNLREEALSYRESQTTVIFRNTFTQTIILRELYTLRLLAQALDTFCMVRI